MTRPSPKTGEALYRITTSNACFGVVVEGGIVTHAAPIAGKIIGGIWSDIAWKYSQVEPVPPLGWELQEGAGGWRAINPERRWSTNVYLGGAEKAIEAAIELERRAMAYLEEQQRQRLALRSYFAALAGVEQIQQRRRSTMTDILEQAAVIFGVPAAVIAGPRRSRHITPARQAVCYAAHKRGYSFKAIGEELGDRDHSSIIWSYDRAEQRAVIDPAYALDLVGLL